MPSKRKRDILEGFDPNKSDSEDENFEPGEDRPRRSKKKSRSSKSKGSSSRRRSAKYRGSDIDDDEELSDSEQEDSFEEGDDDDDDEEEDEDPPVNATGRRMRKAAVHHQSYKESTDEESIVEDSDPGVGITEELQKKPPTRQSRIVILKTDPKNLRGRRAKEPPTPSMSTRRSTRARTEETEEPLVELSTSGRHAQPARSSKSKSPEAMARNTRATRATKGLKKPPAPIQEATQESSSHGNRADPEEEIEGIPATAEPKEDDSDNEVGPADDGGQDIEVEDSFREDPEPEEEMKELEAEGGAETQEAPADDEDEDDIPITRRTRAARASISAPAPAEEADDESENNGTMRRLTRKAARVRKSLQEPSSDFEPGDDSGEGDGSGSEGSKNAGDGGEDDDEQSSPMPRGRRATQSKSKGAKRTRRTQDSGDEEVELDKDEMAEELEELRESSRSRPRRRRRSPSIVYEEPATKRRRTTKPVDYSIKAIDPAFPAEEEEEEAAPTPARRRGRNGANTGWERNFNTTYGPFGGGGGAGALLGGPWGTGATGGVQSDSSDDEMVQRSGVGGNVGMTPTSAVPPGGGLLPGLGQAHNMDGLAGIGGATPNVGKIKNQKAFADADPLGVDMNVDFSKVGGLQGHIDQLKEMVQLPLLYPELFLKFHVTPPRGVLFHGPPGTGKTLLARALANSIGSGGRKITFYMRKGADALSKWVGEAEKQLRLLFEEARRTQPSIIFFDEIDGLAPVRSSKQEQIHASIVSTLLALMDGMDGRGQVIVIGATNRPDNIDPALRRPGRFDREFYFPLPDLEGRRAILDIHTRDWGLSDEFKTGLAENTKGYGGADLRALCTEAALNAIQRTYPQIYSSKERLVVNPDRISVQATDFMLSIKKMVPSSERSASSAAAPLPRSVEPLLRAQFKAAVRLLDDILPRKKKTTALEEAMYEPLEDDDNGFVREALLQEFERSRVFRPRLLLGASTGMGQQYLASAILHHLEGVHVQNFDLANLLGDGRPLEQVIVSLFAEVKRRKPSVIYIPNVDAWYPTVGEAGLATFRSMLRSIPPADPVVVLCTSEVEPDDLPERIKTDLFPFSRKNRALIDRPRQPQRLEFFESVVNHVRKSPTEFPDPSDRKKRILEELPIAPPPPPKPLTKAEIKAQLKVDLHALNILKTRLQPIMDQINRKYRKFRQPVIQYGQVQYLFDETDPHYVRPDLAEGQVRPFEIAKDKDGVEGLKETDTGKFFYNLETTTIEERLSNGFYARPRDFYRDIERLAKDARNIGDKERTLKANELLTNVEVDIHDIEIQLGSINFEELYQRQVRRAKDAEEKAKKRAAMRSIIGLIQSDIAGENDSDSQGPVRIGAAIPGPHTTAARFQVMSPRAHGHNGGSGAHNTSNGTSVPSRQDGEDVQMGGTEDDTQPASLNGSMGPPPSQLARAEGRAPDQSARAATGATQISQVSVLTTVPPGVSPSAIINEASTTRSTNASSKKTWSTQVTNGYHNDAAEPDNSQLPDTQPGAGASGPSQATSSDEQWPHSQAAGMQRGIVQPRNYGTGSEKTSPTSSQIPPKAPSSRAHVASMSHILNESSSEIQTPIRNSGSSASSQVPQFFIQEAQVQNFLTVLVDQTSGCTIEQLEQINRELMDEVWRTRHEWNRMKVLTSLTTVFNETIRDIELQQGMKPSSQQEPVLPHDEPEDGFIRLK